MWTGLYGHPKLHKQACSFSDLARNTSCGSRAGRDRGKGEGAEPWSGVKSFGCFNSEIDDRMQV